MSSRSSSIPHKPTVCPIKSANSNELGVSKSKQKLNSRKLASLKYAHYLIDKIGISSGNLSEDELPDKARRALHSGDYVELISDSADSKTKVLTAFLSGDRWDPMQAHSTGSKRALRLACVCNWILQGEHIEFIEPKAVKKVPVIENDATLWDELKQVQVPDLDRQAEIKPVKYLLLFVTLTVPNVPAEDLSKQHKALSDARRRLLHDFRALKKWVKGYVSSEEVEYNPDTHTFHPHLHLLLAVPSEYKQGRKYALTQNDFKEFWNKAQGKEASAVSIVDVREVYDIKGREGGKRFQELCKYVTKSAELLDYGSDVLDAVIEAYTGQHQTACSGVFREGFKLYEKGELGDYVEAAEKGIEWAYKRSGNWGGMKYAWSKPERLSETESEQVKALTQYKTGELSCETPEGADNEI